MTLINDTYQRKLRKLARPMIARPPTRARAPMPALVLVLEAGCERMPDPLPVGIECGVPVVVVAEGAALRLGVVPNPLRTCWFQPAERVCAIVWTKRVSAENQLVKISLLKLTNVTVT